MSQVNDCVVCVGKSHSLFYIYLFIFRQSTKSLHKLHKLGGIRREIQALKFAYLEPVPSEGFYIPRFNELKAYKLAFSVLSALVMVIIGEILGET